MYSVDKSAVKERIEQALHDMPALPAVSLKILAELDREHASPTDIERLLSSDPSLAAKALRIVNSPYYGLAGKVDSLGQAVVILGLQQIKNVVLSLQEVDLHKTGGASSDMHQALWSHAFGTAVGAQLILKKKRLEATEGELAYMGGLLHDVGKLFLFTTFTREYMFVPEHARENRLSIEEAETELLGTTHMETAKQLVKAWRFPTQLSRLILSYANPPQELNPALYAVHAANALTGDVFEIDQVPREIHPQVVQWLAVRPEELSAISQEIAKRTSVANEFFAAAA